MTSDTIESISSTTSPIYSPPSILLTTLSSITTLRLSSGTNEAQHPLQSELNIPTKATATAVSSSSSSASERGGVSSSSYHLQYEKKQKNVSRLLTKFITPSPLEMASTTTTMASVGVEQIAITTSSTSGGGVGAGGRITAATDTVVTARSPPAAKGANIIYPTVAPESVVIPIVSSIIGFPILALLVICCLRKRAKMARERDRRRNYDMQDHTANLVRFGHRLNGRTSRTLSLCSERSISWAYPSMDLDTVYEERSDPEPYRDKY